LLKNILTMMRVEGALEKIFQYGRGGTSEVEFEGKNSLYNF
jgi:hypothetical protein